MKIDKKIISIYNLIFIFFICLVLIFYFFISKSQKEKELALKPISIEVCSPVFVKALFLKSKAINSPLIII